MRFLSGKAVFGWAFVSGDCVAATDDAGHEVAGDTSQSDAPLLLTPGIGQGLGEAGDREVRRRGSINDRRNDARRQEGKGGEQADVPFALDLTLSNLGEGSNTAEPDVVDPSSSLGEGGEKRLEKLLHCSTFAIPRTPWCVVPRRIHVWIAIDFDTARTMGSFGPCAPAAIAEQEGEQVKANPDAMSWNRRDHGFGLQKSAGRRPREIEPK